MVRKIMRITPKTLDKVNKELQKGFVLGAGFEHDEKNNLYLLFQQMEKIY